MDIYNLTSFESLEDFKSKKLIFISGSRDISAKRIGQIFKENIFRGDILWGCFDENYIEGFEDQIQFQTLKLDKLKDALEKLQKFKLPNEFNILTYSQRDISKVLQKLKPWKSRFINGSWKIVFHRREEFKVIEENNLSFKLISPFCDEAEAKSYSEKIEEEFSRNPLYTKDKKYSDSELLEIASELAKRSFDYTWQTACVLAKNGKIISFGHNRVLPFETYAMLNGSLREKWRSEINDLNNYDTIHAEMDCLTHALNQNIDISDSTLYINLLPCPNCARAISRTKVKEIVFLDAHYGEYSIELFERSGVKVRKV